MYWNLDAIPPATSSTVTKVVSLAETVTYIVGLQASVRIPIIINPNAKQSKMYSSWSGKTFYNLDKLHFD